MVNVSMIWFVGWVELGEIHRCLFVEGGSRELDPPYTLLSNLLY